MAIFFSAATASGAFGGLLARGIMEMDGAGGHAGWAWIFMLEGIATLLVGKCSPRTPTDNRGKGGLLMGNFFSDALS